MSNGMLHVVSPSREDDLATIVGDMEALQRLQRAIVEAIETGSGGTFVFQSDGEGYGLAIVRVADMYPVFTAYLGEVNPIRSDRETVPINHVPQFDHALRKAAQLEFGPINSIKGLAVSA